MSTLALLSTLPVELKLPILYKMQNIPLCRMRRTCSHMNSLIEENQEKLASRPEIGTQLWIAFGRNSIFFSKEYDVYNGIGHDRKEVFDGDDFSRKITAISFTQITFDLIWLREFTNRDLFSRFLETVQLSCDKMEIRCENYNYINEILDSITARREISLFFKKSYQMSYSYFFYSVNKSPKHWGINVSTSDDLHCDGYGLLNLIKDYKSFSGPTFMPEEYSQFLKELKLCEEAFILDRVVCKEDTRNCSLYDHTLNRRHLWNIDYLDNRQYQFKGCPTKISQMSLRNGKIAVLMDIGELDRRILILENNPSEILDLLMKELRIDTMEEWRRDSFLDNPSRALGYAFLASANRRRYRNYSDSE